jgi:uncharacterized protein (TIGR02678 family)
MKELEILLEEFWVIKEKDKDLYYRVKDAIPLFKDFLEQKLGYKLIVNPYMIKLEKLPGKAEPWMGIQGFDDKMEYAFLCLLLVFLEDKSAGEQFVLSEVTEFIQGSFAGGEKVDWTLFRHRKFLVKVLRFAAAIGLMQADDGDEGRFMDSTETEVLYESTGLSRYFMRNFTGNILNYSSFMDMENGEWLDVDRDRGRVRRNRVYRRLVMSPAVYSGGADDPDYLYIKNQRGLLQKDMEDFLDSQLHVHKNGAFLVLNPSKSFKDVFPGRKNISDVVLQMNGSIVDLVHKGELARRGDDTIVVSRVRFEKIIEDVRDRNYTGWGKEFREMPLSRLCEEVISYMKDFHMIEVMEPEKEIRIMPLAGKITGSYPKDFRERESHSEDSE